MRDTRGWLDRTNDPLDQPRRELREDGMEPDPRKLSVPVHRQTIAEAGYEQLMSDPVEILMHCEECDEYEGCACGTHLSEYLAAHQPSSKGK